MRPRWKGAAAGALAAALAALPAGAATPTAPDVGFCAMQGPPYYSFDVVSTGKVPGTARSEGQASVSFTDSPFGVSLAGDGSYAQTVRVELRRLPARARGVWVAWATTTQVDKVARLGVVEDGVVEGSVAWNKFLVVITLEPTDDPSATAWSGPIVLRGMSRSGAMHTMAGHGPFQQENCAKYGYSK